MQNDFGAEYLDGVEAPGFGAKTTATQSCYMDFSNPMAGVPVVCVWHVLYTEF